MNFKENEIQEKFLNKDEVLELLNISPGALDILVKDYMIIACQRGEEILFPAINFFNGSLNDRVLRITSKFKSTNVDGWTIYRWFTEPNDDLYYAGRQQYNVTPYEYVLLFGVTVEIKMTLSVFLITQNT